MKPRTPSPVRLRTAESVPQTPRVPDVSQESSYRSIWERVQAQRSQNSPEGTPVAKEEFRKFPTAALEPYPRFFTDPVAPRYGAGQGVKLRDFVKSQKVESQKVETPKVESQKLFTAKQSPLGTSSLLGKPNATNRSASTPSKSKSSAPAPPAEAPDRANRIQNGTTDDQTSPRANLWKCQESGVSQPQQQPLSLQELNESINSLRLEVSKMNINMRTIVRNELGDLKQSMQRIIRSEMETYMRSMNMSQMESLVSPGLSSFVNDELDLIEVEEPGSPSSLRTASPRPGIRAGTNIEKAAESFPAISMGMLASVTQNVKLLEKVVRDCNMDWPSPSSERSWTTKLGKSGCITQVDTEDRTAFVSNDIGWVPISALITEQGYPLESDKQEQPFALDSKKEEQPFPADSVGMLISVTQDVKLLEKAVRDCEMDWPNASSGMLWTSNLGKSGSIMEVDESDKTAMVSNDIGWVPISALIQGKQAFHHGSVMGNQM